MIKPRTLGVLTKAERRKVGASYIVSALGMFDLARPDAERFETDQALWLLAAKGVPKGAALDTGMPKPRAELLIGGVARAPAGQPTTAMTVEWMVGPLRKRLVVFGDRYWRIAGAGYAATPPRPFVEAPLSPERAFGGEGFADNPGGLGYHAMERTRAGELVALPNVEHADDLVLTPESRPAPALCGPMDLASPKRRRYGGTYDANWIKNVAPALPDDVDPRLFLTAPDDQVFPGYLVGGEPYALRGFSPDEPELRGALPAFRVRGFLARKGVGGAADELVEIEMRCDTLWLFAGARRGVLIYRGALPVNDIDADDLSAVMLAYERAADEPRSFESYVEVWRLRRDRKSAFRYAFAEGQLAPALRPEIVARRNTERAALMREKLERHQDGQAWFVDRQLAEAGVPVTLRPTPPKQEFDEELLNFPMPTPDELEEGEIDLAAILDGMEAVKKGVQNKTEELSDKASNVQDRLAELRAPGAGPASVDSLLAALDALAGGETAKLLDAAQTDVKPAPPSAVGTGGAPADEKEILDRAKDWRRLVVDSLHPTADDDAEFHKALARFLDLPEGRPLFDARQSVEASRLQTLEASAPPESPLGSTPAQPADAVDIYALLDGVAEDLSTSAESSSSFSRNAAKSNLAVGQAKIQEQLVATFPQLNKEGTSPLTALLDALGDGSGGDRSSAADPVERSRAAAEKQRERLEETSKTLEAQEAELVRGLAQMRLASPEPTYPQKAMSRPLARRFGDFVIGQHMTGVSLAGRDLAGADLRGADLAGADLEGALLEQADLTGAHLAGARLTGAALTGAILDGADLSDVDLTEANLAKCRARRTIFSRSRFEGSLLHEADFSGADFRGARLNKLKSVNTTFEGADFSGATIGMTSIVQTSLATSVWNGASLEAISIMDLSLTGAQFRGARLVRCSFMKVQASGCDFEDAGLERCGFLGECDLREGRFKGAVGSSCSFHEADLSGATFEGSVFNRSSFMKSNLTAVSFRLASLKGSMFGGARAPGADFIGANLLGAQLRRADLSGARMIGANLYGANLDHTSLIAADLTGANLAKTYLAVDTHAG